ncbi:ABC transporter substrate-binding protein [Mycobacterium simiae]|uniref:ABC transporter substrate-binding protein n=2 Tax=Mycobacterium simiae TaxID=1784 RepID=A0A1X0XQ07_MYCSI|nr:ABC transporter substrate-binding protein [Mycobacterium simiae]
MSQLDRRRPRAGSRPARRTFAMACLVGAATITSCGSGGSAHLHDAPIVASTDVWGSVAQAVAGPHLRIKSILRGANVDPHTYQATAADAAAVADARLVICNGGGYDPWLTQVLDQHPNIKSVNAYSFAAKPVNGSPPNEHVFYDLNVAKSVATAIADRLVADDANDAGDYRANAAAFGREADAIAAAEHSIARTYPDTSVVATEPVAYYLIQAIGLVNRTPPAFASANENGTDPTPADMAFVLDLVNRHQVAAVLLNPQTETPAINGLQDAAKHAGVPVVLVTESLPDGTEYLNWQRNTVNQLQAALRSGRADARH